MKDIKRIVCTGGPCSGKTSFMSRVQEIFGERGYKVFIDHEAATDLISGGISPATMGMYQFQKYCIALQLKKEELFEQAANEIEGDKVLIFYDRGILDDKGYVTPEDFTTILSDFDTTEEKAKMHYDLVLHLTTAAKGAEEAYTLSNNEARYEGVEEARRVDDTILASWEGHPNRVVINNEDEFEIKMRKAVQAVFTFLGQNKPVEEFRKYLVNVDEALINELKNRDADHTHIVQHFLKSTPGTEKRIRRREKGDSVLFYYSDANMLTPFTRVKTDRIINERQYMDYLVEIDQNLSPIDKERYSFTYGNHFFRLDIFDFDQSKGLLSAQIIESDEQVELPDFIEVIRDVSDVVNYKNYYLAKTRKF